MQRSTMQRYVKHWVIIFYYMEHVIWVKAVA